MPIGAHRPSTERAHRTRTEVVTVRARTGTSPRRSASWRRCRRSPPT